jgi:large subunit ribosomal protein L14e
LVDGPVSETGVPRQLIPYKQLALTDIKIDISRKPSLADLESAFKGEGVNGQWEATAWAKKIAAKRKRANLTDFERFRVMRKKQEVRVKFSLCLFQDCLPRFLSIHRRGRPSAHKLSM